MVTPGICGIKLMVLQLCKLYLCIYSLQVFGNITQIAETRLLWFRLDYYNVTVQFRHLHATLLISLSYHLKQARDNEL